MTNEQIITNVAMQIMDPDDVHELIENGLELPIHTISGWKKRGFQVKEEEKGIACRLWSHNKKNKDMNSEEKQRDFYLCNAYLYTLDQVIKIQDNL